MSVPWWAALRPAQSQISCGAGQHLVRWADGELTAADHPDAEGELVLAALGGDKSDCVTLVEAWGAHAEDLDVLALGPRSPADQLTVTWDLVQQPAVHDQPAARPATQPASQAGQAAGAAPPGGSGPGRCRCARCHRRCAGPRPAGPS